MGTIESGRTRGARVRAVIAAAAAATCALLGGGLGCVSPEAASGVVAADASVIAPDRATADAPVFVIEAAPQDDAVAAVREADLRAGRALIEAFFGLPFRDDVAVTIAPDRAAFTAAFPPEWGMSDTACWMVATGVADFMVILSPRVWGTEACEHDATDARHVRDIVVHELVHVFHGQHNPTRDFTGAEEIGWFAEGLAVHVSGQLHRGRLAEPREAVELGLGPERLADAWSGRYRYGVSGSLVAFFESRVGREGLRQMLAVTNQEDLLAILKLDEQQCLAQWREYVLAR